MLQLLRCSSCYGVILPGILQTEEGSGCSSRQALPLLQASGLTGEPTPQATSTVMSTFKAQRSVKQLTHYHAARVPYSYVSFPGAWHTSFLSAAPAASCTAAACSDRQFLSTLFPGEISKLFAPARYDDGTYHRSSPLEEAGDTTTTSHATPQNSPWYWTRQTKL